MKWIAAASVAGLALLGAGTAAGTDSSSQPPIVWGTCSVCHGLNGISPNRAFPNLAGQPDAYLKAELNDFRDRSRADHDAQAYMWSMAGNISSHRIDPIAQYFSSLKPPKGMTGGDPAEIAAGQKIYQQGIASENVPACQTCHADQAAGKDAFPRLAGQHREYLVAQLEAFRSKSRNDPIMSPLMEHVSDAQIRDLTAYLSSL